MSYIPDPIEQMESRIDRMEDRLDIQGDTFLCPHCGERQPFAGAEPMFPHPDSMPICAKCVYGIRSGDDV